MPVPFHHATLPNGLQVIAEPSPDAHSVALGLFVNAGSRDELPQLNGVSHFLEHMMFKGSDRYTWEDVNRIFDEIGANHNAYTTQEMTAYYAQVLPEFTRPAIEHLAQLLRPAIRQSDFDTEKNVILEEIKMYFDEPESRLYERLMEEHFAGHPLAQPVLGTPATVAAMTRGEMVDFFAGRYGPGNMVLAASGAIPFDRLVELAGEFCGHWQRVSPARQYPRRAPGTERRVRMTDPKLSRAYAMAMAPAPGAQDERRFAAKVMADILGDADGSRLYWALVEEAIAEDAELAFYPHDREGSFFLALTADPDRLDEALDIARKEIATAADSLTQDELDRARNKIATSLVLSGESPMGRMRSLGSMWLYTGEYRSLEQDMATLAAITLRDLRQLLSDFPLSPMTVVELRP